ncbi:unnamed protein product [Blepharisma stoltei]|uniref:RNase H type-1 domain-containing protein n=1 Tax=Blepharisma stoltei TaxID=1481888 RepID=A0AAU9IME9_9CILI|nr:unnamed protein product [Blepharisma stoltei]
MSDFDDIYDSPHKKRKILSEGSNEAQEKRLIPEVFDITESLEKSSSTSSIGEVELPNKKISKILEVPDPPKVDEQSSAKPHSIWLAAYRKLSFGPIGCSYIIKNPSNEVLSKSVDTYYTNSKSLGLLKHAVFAIKFCAENKINDIIMYTEEDSIVQTFDQKSRASVVRYYKQWIEITGMLNRLGINCRWKWAYKTTNAEACKMAKDWFESQVIEEVEEWSAKQLDSLI